MSNTGWRALNQACLTKATQSATAPALGKCSATVGSPTPTFNAGTSNTGLPSGYLQLTDDSKNQVGAVIYNRAIPAKHGLVAEFTQYQFGRNDDGGDGIGFFWQMGPTP